MAAMNKRDPDRYAELHRQKGRQLVAEARAAREMSRAGVGARAPDVPTHMAPDEEPRGDAAR
jgi:hypothetical protein